jgi:cytochrome c-type biogenesis protein
MVVDSTAALAAGLVATVNPCGFALLPAWMSLLMVDGPVGPHGTTRRALVHAGAMTAGFVLVLGVFGPLVTPDSGTAGKALPWATIAVGLALAGIGGWLSTGRQQPGFVPKLGRVGAVHRSALSMTLFGVGFAVVSLDSTIGPFQAVVVTGFQAREVFTGIGLVVSYAVGVGLFVGGVALVVALARMWLVRRLRRVGGLVMLLAGAYVAYHGWHTLRVLDGRAARDPIVDIVTAAQNPVSGWLDMAGVTSVAAVFGVLLVGVPTVAALRRGTRV